MDNQKHIDIAKEWQTLMEKKFNHSNIEKEDIMKAISQDSKSTISELKKRLRYKLNWTLFFIVAFSMGFFFSANNGELFILNAFVVVSYIMGFAAMMIKYRGIKEEAMEDIPLLQLLKSNLKAIKSVLRFENVWGIIVFAPMIVVSVLGGKLISGTSIAESLSDPTVLIIALVGIIVLVPVLLWAGHKMNQFAYGELLKKIEDNIVKRETLI